ncbi:MAG: acyl carrier protein [Candidatus Glassbacteria bacterium]|nr:acyl carrier protein [Candidatus Glassbacteria bacterium]
MAEHKNLESVIHLLRAHKCANEKIDAGTPIDLLEIESIRMADFVLSLEEEFSILVTDERFKRWTKVGDIADYIETYLEKYGTGELGEM